MKKLFFALAISLFIPLHAAIAFYSDVPESHEYYNDIKALYDLHRLPESANFEPDKTATNGDFYELLITYTQAPLSQSTTSPYINIESTDPYLPFLQTAIDYKIIQPAGKDSTFPIKLPAKKYQVLKKMFETLGVGVNYFFDQTNFPFTDIDSKAYIAPVAKKAADLKIFETENTTKFQAFKSLTKAEIAHYLNQIYKYKPGETTITIENIVSNKAQEHEDLATFLDVWDRLHESYLYQDQLKDSEKLELSAIQAVLSQLDDKYTIFEEPADAEALIGSLSGELQGVGLTLDMIDEKITVVAPMKDSPAEEAGIKANDIIIKVDGIEVSGLTINEVAKKIRGKAGTKVEITLLRGGKETTYNLTRDYLVIESVTSEIMTKGNKDIAYIAINSFGSTTFKEFQTNVEKMLAEEPKGFIIDLRNNPGGFVDTSTQIVSQFTAKSEDVIVTLRYNNGEEDNYHLTGKEGPLAGQKVVVLVNEGSASASEIVAGALQDMGIAKVIGTQTFGKGTAQEVVKYVNGSLFKYTIAEWITPKGRKLNGTGVTPDEIVKNTGTTDQQLAEALKEF